MMTYVTYLSSDDYVEGALVLHASLKRVRSKYRLVALLTVDISAHSEATLAAFGIRIKRLLETAKVPEDLRQRNAAQNLVSWNMCFDKLFIFELTEYEQIVYVDCDMLVRRNIDELFERPHMSAVAAGRNFPGNESWVDLNAGLMVVHPQPGLLQKIMATLPAALKSAANQSDQTLLHHYKKDWPNSPALHLDESYNIFIETLDHYVRVLGYHLFGKNRIAIPHFTGAIKPWHRTPSQQRDQLRTFLFDRNYNQLAATLLYLRELRKVRKLKRAKHREINQPTATPP